MTYPQLYFATVAIAAFCFTALALASAKTVRDFLTFTALGLAFAPVWYLVVLYAALRTLLLVPSLLAPGLFLRYKLTAEVGFDSRLKAAVDGMEEVTEASVQVLVNLMMEEPPAPEWAARLEGNH